MSARISKIKVFGGTLDGRHRVVMAAKSRAELLRLMTEQGANVNANFLRDYFCETGNRAEVELAISEPGTLFAQVNYGGRDAEWFKWKDKHSKG